MHASQLAVWENSLGKIAPQMIEFLGTLGLKYRDGKPKLGFLAFTEEAKRRGWN